MTDKRNTVAALPAVIPFAMTIPQFCKLHNISRSTFFVMVKEGRGPQVWYPTGRTGKGAKALITQEAAAAWRAAGYGERAA